MTSGVVFSIVVPLFNRQGLVVETLQSIAAQTCRSFEAIIVDDHSTDRGPEQVQTFAENDARFRFIRRTTEGRGAPICRNIGLQNSRGEFIVFLDSDDLLAPHCLEQRLDLFTAEPDYDLVVSQGIIFKEHLGDSQTLWNRCDYLPDDLTRRFLDQDMPFQTTGPTWRRSSITEIGAWNNELLLSLIHI